MTLTYSTTLQSHDVTDDPLLLRQFVPQELKDEKYWARRRKNNLAAKRSRDARRLKENQIAMRANFLEKEVGLASECKEVLYSKVV